MKKAVITSGGRQYLVAEGDELEVNYLGADKKTVNFTPIMMVDGKNSIVDSKKLEVLKVGAKVIENELQGDKVMSIRYKSKKRVNTKRGHRQKLSKIKITSI